MSNLNVPHGLRLLFNKSEIKNRVSWMGMEISKEYRENCLLYPVVVIALKGGAVFGADLVREFLPDLRSEVQIEYVWASSHGPRKTPAGEVNLGTLSLGSIAEFSWMEGKDILFADDVLETGRTRDVMEKTVRKYGPIDSLVAEFEFLPLKRADRQTPQYSYE